MEQREVDVVNFRSQFMNILVVIIIAIAMVAAIMYFYRSEPDYQRQTMRLYASTYINNVRLANANWQVEGKPLRVMLVQYDNTGQAGERYPVVMGKSGWPSPQGEQAGCEKLWRGLIGTPLNIENFKVMADYIRPNSDSNKQGICRYRLSTGPYFEYDPNSGRLNTENM